MMSYIKLLRKHRELVRGPCVCGHGALRRSWAGAGADTEADTGSGPEELTADVSELLEDRESGCRGPGRSSCQGARPVLAKQSSAPPPGLLGNAGGFWALLRFLNA